MAHNQFAMPQQPQSFQQQQFNPHSSLISESGCESMNADQTINNPYFRQQQQQNPQNPRANFSMSYINSPQQMSTPMVMRTKDQLNGSLYGQPQQNFQQMHQPSAVNSQFQAQPQQSQDIQFKQLQSECEIHFSGTKIFIR